MTRPAAATHPPTPACLVAHADGKSVVLHVVVVPNASSTQVVGLHGDALRVRLAAPPVDGKANAALTAWLAQSLELPRAQVELLSGASARRKRLRLHIGAEQARAWLARVLPADAAGGG